MPHLDDRKLLELISSDKETDNNLAFTEIYAREKGKIISMVLNNSGNLEEAEDIVQDGLIALYNKCQKNKGFEISCSLGTYLYSICRNLWLMQIRRKGIGAKVVSALETVEVEESTMQSIFREEKYKALTDMVSRLKEECIKILTKYYVDGMSIREIKEKLGLVSEQVVKNKKLKCINTLRGWIGESGGLKSLLRSN